MILIIISCIIGYPVVAQQLQCTKQHSDRSKIYSVAWSPDSQSILSAGNDGYLQLHNAFTSKYLARIQLVSIWVMACAYSPSGKFVASGGLDNTCTIHKLPNSDQVELATAAEDEDDNNNNSDPAAPTAAATVVATPLAEVTSPYKLLSEHEGYESCFIGLACAYG